LIVADVQSLLVLSGDGDVIEPDDGVVAIGSGAPYATAAAKALVENTDLDARAIVEAAMKIAADICIFTNDHFTIEAIDAVDEATDGQASPDDQTIDDVPIDSSPSKPLPADRDEEDEEDEEMDAAEAELARELEEVDDEEERD
jgi:hypothetical protein